MTKTNKFDSPVKFYNTLSRKKELFVPIKKTKIGLYCCGPTVYWHQHIGNLRTYISEDLLKRVLIYNGYKVEHVINITDVGHLTSDTDVGEDKLVKAIKREKLPLTEKSMLLIADKYFDEFKLDLKKLNIIMPNFWTKATEHVSEMINQIKLIEKHGYTYKTSVGLIFNTAKFKNYAKLGKLNLKELEKGARGKKDEERKNASDFALWLTNQPNHLMQWDSQWGRGFPGWHIECSAMSMKYLGEQFDIHCGGPEHIQVHHSNELAQAEAATNKSPWVKYWLHTGWLVLKDMKMSKSKGSIYTLSDLIKKGYDPLAFKYFTFTAHYKNPLTFTFEALNAAQVGFNNLKQKVIEFKKNKTSKPNKDLERRFQEGFRIHLNNDLDMPQALATVWNLIKHKELGNREKLNLLLDFDQILGFDIKNMKEEKVEISDNIKQLIKERETARKNKNWKLADQIRDKLKTQGITLLDTKDGIKWKKK